MTVDDLLLVECESCGRQSGLPRARAEERIAKVRCSHCGAVTTVTTMPGTRDSPGPAPALPFRPRVGGEPVDRPEAPERLPFDFHFDSHYDVLGVSPSAPIAAVTEAAFAMTRQFRRLALQGDRVAQVRLDQITAAQETLTNAEKRAAYDELPDALFLSTQDPFPAEDEELATGLRNLRHLVLGQKDRDPLVDAGSAAGDLPSGRSRPNALLDSMLADEKGGGRG